MNVNTLFVIFIFEEDIESSTISIRNAETSSILHRVKITKRADCWHDKIRHGSSEWKRPAGIKGKLKKKKREDFLEGNGASAYASETMLHCVYVQY